MTRARSVLAGSYSSPLMFCADRSPRKYITSELQNCVVYGRFRWFLPYASNPRERGPRRCHIGRVGTVLGTGMEVPLAGSSSGFGLVVLFELNRLAVCCLCERCDLRKTDRMAVFLATNAGILRMLSLVHSWYCKQSQGGVSTTKFAIAPAETAFLGKSGNAAEALP